MPRAKKKKSPIQNAAQFSRTTRKTGKWRGKVKPEKVKSGQKPKRIWDKEPLKVNYQSKYSEYEDGNTKL